MNPVFDLFEKSPTSDFMSEVGSGAGDAAFLSSVIDRRDFSAKKDHNELS
jgi:hypothetical protein